jgi:uridine kinase
LIVGNSGSGKSWLSRELGERLRIAAIDLDSIHWEPEGFEVARDKDAARLAVRQIAARENWIIEGVYGWLAREAASRATTLIWLDIPVEECLENLRLRGARSPGEVESFAALLAWAADYPHRETSSSQKGHEEIFMSFSGCRARLCSRDRVREFLAAVPLR